MFKVLSGEELLALPSEPKVVRLDGEGHIELYNRRLRSWGYWFDLTQIKTRRGLIRFIHHLSEKNWITVQHIRELIEIVVSDLHTL